MHTTRKLLVAGLVALAVVSLPTGTVAADATSPSSIANSAGDDVAMADLGAVGPSGGVVAATNDVTTDCHIWLVDGPECRHDEDEETF